MADDYYEFLGVARTASSAEIKKAYYKKAVECHPDRARDEDREIATATFQRLGRIYAILSDERLREMYDRTGSVDDDEMNREFGDRDWSAYWRELFPRLTREDYDNFAAKYRGSAEEVKDVCTAYLESKGDMGAIIDSVYCATPDDEDRFRAILEPRIADGTLEAFKRFTHESAAQRARRRKAQDREARQAEKALRELKQSEQGTLAQIVQRRSADRMSSLIANLESKYAKSPSGTKKKTSAAAPPPDISDDEFNAIQARLFGDKDSSSSKGGATSSAAADSKRRRRA